MNYKNKNDGSDVGSVFAVNLCPITHLVPLYSFYVLVHISNARIKFLKGEIITLSFKWINIFHLNNSWEIRNQFFNQCSRDRILDFWILP